MLVAIASVAARSASFLAQLVLGRLLVPEDFGLFAIALTFTTFAAAGNSVLRSFLVDALKKGWDFDRLYRLIARLTLLVTVVSVAVSPFIAAPFDVDGLGAVLFFLFAAMPLQILPAFGAARLNHRLDFGALSSVWTWSAVLRQGVTVLAALLGFGAMSFVAGVFAGSIAELWMVRVRSGPSPKFLGPIFPIQADVRSQLKWVPMSILVLALWINGDYAAAGLFESAAVVGVYFFAYQLTTALTQPFTLAISSVLLPSLSSTDSGESGSAKDRDREAFRLTILLVPLLSGLPFALLAVVAAPATHLLWSAEWDVATNAIIVLALATPMKLLLSTSLSVFQARGNWGGYTRILGLSAAVTVAAAAAGGAIGGVGGLVAVIALANICLGLMATAAAGSILGLSAVESVIDPATAWLLWVFAFGVTALSSEVLSLSASSIPFKIAVLLTTALPIAFALYGDQASTLLSVGRRRSPSVETYTSAEAPTSADEDRLRVK